MSITTIQLKNELRKRIRIRTIRIYELISDVNDLQDALKDVSNMDIEDLLEEEIRIEKALSIIEELCNN